MPETVKARDLIPFDISLLIHDADGPRAIGDVWCIQGPRGWIEFRWTPTGLPRVLNTGTGKHPAEAHPAVRIGGSDD